MRKPVFLADYLALLPNAVLKAQTWRRQGHQRVDIESLSGLGE